MNVGYIDKVPATAKEISGPGVSRQLHKGENSKCFMGLRQWLLHCFCVLRLQPFENTEIHFSFWVVWKQPMVSSCSLWFAKPCFSDWTFWKHCQKVSNGLSEGVSISAKRKKRDPGVKQCNAWEEWKKFPEWKREMFPEDSQEQAWRAAHPDENCDGRENS